MKENLSLLFASHALLDDKLKKSYMHHHHHLIYAGFEQKGGRRLCDYKMIVLKHYLSGMLQLF